MAFPDSDSDGDIAVAVQGATVTYGDFTAVNNVSVDFPRGKFTCIIGPNGCGKSTLLRMLAGLESISGGEILIGGRRVDQATQTLALSLSKKL